ncbi:glutathione S-transferase family protein [Pseudothauera rhizosphaerae]|uniref:Glutathione S-transferase family protein n=1 Tax=Pseudothauera rhizosphaerae TaxID=2565932 RepID=A0A4S4ATN9_9RHOO|nr:glutathione S-transferase family protein [Pseudothauera rhizosphaerae]THF63271.1 glutathione S-transferase family protein [Pseudothauera rhizosphaerae]
MENRYVLHIANKTYSSWSLRPWALMRTLGIPFEERLSPFAPGSNWNAFRAFSPSGRVPCLHHGAQVVWDSLAIAEYLAERHAGVWPEDAKARAWARCAAAEMHSGFGALREQCSMHVALRIRMRAIGPALRKDLDRLDELWREGLERFGGPFLAGGQFGAVDAFFAPVAFRVQAYDLPLSAAARGWVDRVLALPALREWEAAALAEPWRDEDHEREALAAGTLIEDRRPSATPR